MLPISLSQIKSFNVKNQFKIAIWAIFRSFQLKNKKKFNSIYFDKDTEKAEAKIYIPSNIETVKTIKKDTLIIIKKVKASNILKRIFRMKNLRLADISFFLTSEASTNMRLWFYDFSSENDREGYKNISFKNLNKLVSLINTDKICLLGTGPSFQKAVNVFKTNNYIITCNSAIYENDLWEEKKNILCFADPVYHFGKSTEALRFKSEVIKKFNNSKFFIVCPIECFPILKHSWGIDENFIIGLSRDKKSKYKNINNEFIYIKKTSNILTEFMLPLATMISKNIYLGGFDGREVNEENFWKYSKTTDQNIEQHQSQHPSFFQDRDMEKYYVSHLAILEKQINELEKKGFMIKNITNSNIKFLNTRNDK